MALKADIINTAYSHLVISGVSLGPSDEDTSLALDILEDMAAEFEARNICTGYNLQDEPDVNDESNVPRQFLNAFKTNLAIRLVAAFGKQAPPTLMTQANQSLSSMSARTAQVRQVQYPNRMPRGSGSTLRFNRYRRFFREAERAPISCATNQMRIGEINDYVEHFDSYLNEIEDIDTYTIQADAGLSIVSSSNETPDINYRVEATGTNKTGSTWQLVKITITTTEGRKEIREISFNITE